MTIKEKTKEKLDDAGKEIKAAIDNLGKEVSELSKKVKEKFKGAGEELKETAEELSKEVKKLSERAKDILPKRSKAQAKLPVGIDKPPAIFPEDTANPFLGLVQATNRLFDDFLRGFGMPAERWGEPLTFAGDIFGRQWPRVDMTETDKDIRITAELAGVNKDDISISLSEGRITIRGEKKEEEEDKGKDFYRLERSYGSFQRTLSVPCEIKEDSVDASFKDGVLKIILPKTETARERTKKISIKEG